MQIERYRKNEDFKDGYNEACFDFAVGNVDKDAAFRLIQNNLDIVRKEYGEDDDDDNAAFRDLFKDEDDETENNNGAPDYIKGFDAGFENACFEIAIGNITKEDAYRIASKQYGDIPAFKSAEEKTPHEAYAHGYAQGHIDGYNHGYNQAIFDVDSHQLSEDDYLQCIEKYCMENRIDYDRGDDDEDYDCSEHCDMFDIGFKQGYKQGYEDYYEEAANRKREYPEELYLEAAPFNAIEAIKDEIREIAYNCKVDKSINDACWKVIDHLMTLEKELAGNAVIDQYLIEDSI